jgi:hypothetical protein
VAVDEPARTNSFATGSPFRNPWADAEVATLRAIGFGPAPVVVSVMIEALVLAATGGVIERALAWGYCNGASLRWPSTSA